MLPLRFPNSGIRAKVAEAAPAHSLLARGNTFRRPSRRDSTHGQPVEGLPWAAPVGTTPARSRGAAQGNGACRKRNRPCTGRSLTTCSPTTHAGAVVTVAVQRGQEGLGQSF
ncbi:hypothetical protein BHE74_00056106 [Ensete ventricosum]|nr:hypothetical protein BHE74_00056106 [Ensete ventricosum]